MRWSGDGRSAGGVGGAALHAELPQPGPLPLVETDPTQIRQVVLNLIVNAAEAVDDHGVITVRPAAKRSIGPR